MSFLSDVNKIYIHLSDFALGLDLKKEAKSNSEMDYCERRKKRPYTE